MYEVSFSRRARRYLQRVDANVRRRLNARISELQADPIFHPHSKLMHGRAGYRRNEMGNLRIVYTVDRDNQSIRIREIGPRGDVYRNL